MQSGMFGIFILFGMMFSSAKCEGNQTNKTDHYVRVYYTYTVTDTNSSYTVYKLCCGKRGESKCDGFGFDPLHRYGSRNVSTDEKEYIIDANSISDNLLIAMVLAIAMYPAWYVLVARPKELKAWVMPPDDLEIALLLIAERANLLHLSFAERDVQSNGQHTFLDFCRTVASREMHRFEQMQNEIRRIELKKKRKKNTTGYKNSAYPSGEHHKKKKQPDSPDEIKKLADKNVRKILQELLDGVKYQETRDVFYVTDIKSTGMGHYPFDIVRKTHVHQESMFDYLYCHGPYRYNWNIRTLIETFDEARELFSKDALCVQISGPTVVIGDIRGRYLDLHRWIDVVGLPYQKNLLFLGNIIEPDFSEFSETSVECIAFVASLKIAYPNHVFMLRGAAECVFSFLPRHGTMIDLAILTAARQMCNYLPIAAQLDNDTIAVPSGIHHNMSQDTIWEDDLKRPLKPDAFPEIVKFLIFGQPTATTRIYEKNNRGLFMYGLQAVFDLTNKKGIRRIIRSRSNLAMNPMFLADRRLLSFNSIPKPNTPGVALYLDNRIGSVFFKLHFQETQIQKPKHYQAKERKKSRTPHSAERKTTFITKVVNEK